MSGTEKPEEHMPERRLALAAGVGALLGVATARVGKAAASTETPETPEATRKRRWGMAIDLDSCSGCNSCQIACRQENNIPTYGPEEKYASKGIEWMSMLWQEPSDPARDEPLMLPFPCLHCEDAPCVKVCPVGATYTDSEGICVMVYDRCIGCRYCQVACPYGRRSFNWEEPRFEGTLAQMLNPDVPTRTAGIVEKCTMCSHRITSAKEGARVAGRELTDDDVTHLPACASACPSDAITFGDLADPESRVSKLESSPRTYRLLEHLGTKPRVFYLKRRDPDES